MDIRRKMKPLLQFGRVRDHVQSTLRRRTSPSTSTQLSARAGGTTQSDTDSGASLGLRSLFGGTDAAETPSPEAESAANSRTGASGNLFQCSTCKSVYIAEEKETCPSCETDVEQVRSTFERE
ncbi:small CPxCG-related zinc finger protein [Natrialba magadii ATCC 43099]|uniref:Small CPxCG-related zinc finger protein n=1 Tax=Natrialba magadii (strain ATCC 43099 / DSM 3394 / CCM 3739 / CIP 104546 / IAM 13178 / JCM 8861 / NBRC 102185 / NCIMB 2190 / MS3) TaxID=547559 RepID=D3SWJ6_NATMM|nr:hypothetical protein [Natrialba magadii]ADD03788.1 small CPxCG-related zinc finger protein [Natrialba magadii ATCC 43099]ELY33843.1 hypothetical protein C500_01418 [Natrialba magadii ATCC 43099]